MSLLVRLQVYVLGAIVSWSPHVADRAPERARLESIALDIAAVAASSPPAFDDDDDAHSKTALLLTSIPRHETGDSWAEWIDDGRCNLRWWRLTHQELLWRNGADCDGSRAWGMWQVHVPGDSYEAGLALVRDRRNVIRAALVIATRSLRSGARLCGYTGEAFPKCPKGDRRLGDALAYADAHPFAPALAAATP
jgi:hypothetical protein